MKVGGRFPSKATLRTVLVVALALLSYRWVPRPMGKTPRAVRPRS